MSETAWTTIKIGGSLFQAVRLDPDPRVASVAWRLLKPNGESYDIYVDRFGPHCECRDAIYRKEGTRAVCKHVEALQNLEMIP